MTASHRGLARESAGRDDPPYREPVRADVPGRPANERRTSGTRSAGRPFSCAQGVDVPPYGAWAG